MEVEIEFIAGLRKNSKLLYVVEEKQIYLKKYTRNNVSRYCCYERDKCNARLIVDDITNKVIRFNKTRHPHADQENLMKKMKLLNCMKEDCMNNPLKRRLTARDIFDVNRMQMDDETVEVNFKRIKRNLNKIKRQSLPECPKIPRQVEHCFGNKLFLEKYGKSKQNATEEVQIQSYLVKEEELLHQPFPIDICAVKEEQPYFEPPEQSFTSLTSCLERGDYESFGNGSHGSQDGLQYNSSNFDGSEIAEIDSNANARHDEHLTYGNYIATMLQSCNRTKREIDIAKQQIDNIISSLRMGAYSADISADESVGTASTSLQPAVPSIILKQEPDL